MVRSHELSPPDCAHDLAIVEHGVATDNRAHDLAREFTPEIRTHTAARLQVTGPEGPTLSRVDERKVCVGADGNRTFARIDAKDLRRRGRREMRDALEREPARVHPVREQHRQRGLNPGDPAPGLPDIMLTALLGGGGAG